MTVDGAGFDDSEFQSFLLEKMKAELDRQTVALIKAERNENKITFPTPKMTETTPLQILISSVDINVESNVMDSCDLNGNTRSVVVKGDTRLDIHCSLSGGQDSELAQQVLSMRTPVYLLTEHQYRTLGNQVPADYRDMTLKAGQAAALMTEISELKAKVVELEARPQAIYEAIF